MTTITNSAVRTLITAFAALVLLAIPFAVAPKAHAADLFGGDSYDYSYPIDNGSSYDYSYPTDTSYSYDYSYPTYTGSSYDYSYPTNYSSPSYSDYGSSYGSGYGSSYMPSYGGFGGGMGGGMSQSQSSTNVNTNVNSCTAGSCNTAINAPTNIVNNNSTPGSVVYAPSQPVYPQPVYYPQQPVYQPTYQPAPVYQQPIAYNRPAPYVALSAVPYTGLDLGPVGTALYWGFLILWCLGAAYLVVVKRVQNKLVNALNGFLFGNPSQEATHTAHTPVIKHAAPSVQFSGIDPFIASQISRA